MKKLVLATMVVLFVGGVLYSAAGSPPPSEAYTPLPTVEAPQVCRADAVLAFPDGLVALDMTQLIDPGCKADCWEDKLACDYSGAPRWVCKALYNECIAAC